MFRILTLLIAMFIVGLSSEAYAQDAGPQAQTLAAALDKTKYKKKEKKNISIEVYVNIKNTPAVKGNPADYSGVYEAENDYSLELKIAKDGSTEGTGYDALSIDRATAQKRFTLRDARVDGALLTATKVFENGETEKFEAVFADRKVSVGKNANTIETENVSFGLGFVQSGKDWSNRIFLEKQD